MNNVMCVACAGVGSFLSTLATLPFLPLATAALVGVVASAMCIKYLESNVRRQLPPWTPQMSEAHTWTKTT